MLTEAQEQRIVVEWCSWKHVPCYHIPNGGTRDIREAKNLKLQGVKAGVPDLCIPVAAHGKHGLYIEMKREKGGTVSEHQREWLDLLNENGYQATVCHGSSEAISAIREYLDG